MDHVSFWLKTGTPYLPKSYTVVTEYLYTVGYRLQSRNMKCDSITSKEVIGSIEFNVFNVKIYLSSGKKILDQFLYTKLIHRSAFGIVVSANNDSDRDAILNALGKSVLKKKSGNIII